MKDPKMSSSLSEIVGNILVKLMDDIIIGEFRHPSDNSVEVPIIIRNIYSEDQTNSLSFTLLFKRDDQGDVWLVNSDGVEQAEATTKNLAVLLIRVLAAELYKGTKHV